MATDGPMVALSKRRLSPYFLFGLLLVLAYISLRIVGVFFDYVLLALFLVYLTYPAYTWLHRRVRHAPLASILMIVALTVLVLAPSVLLAAQLVDEVRDITVGLSGLDAAAISDIIGGRINDALGLGPESRDSVVQIVDSSVRSIEEALKSWVAHLPAALAGILLGLFVLLYVMYYGYTSGPRLIAFVREALPMQESHRDLLFDEVGKVIRAVMYGTVLTALIQAVLGTIGFLIFGVDNVIFWGLIMFVLALLPIVGPPLVWAPWGIYLIVSDRPFDGIGLLVYSAIMVSTIDNVIRPKLIGAHAQVHPVVILLGVLGGIAVFGFVGIILGPLVLSIFVSILNVYRKEFALKMRDDALTPT